VLLWQPLCLPFGAFVAKWVKTSKVDLSCSVVPTKWVTAGAVALDVVPFTVAVMKIKFLTKFE